MNNSSNQLIKNKAQQFRKQIRRKDVEEILKKRRIAFSQNAYSEQQLSKKVQQTLQLIRKENCYSSNLNCLTQNDKHDNNYRNDNFAQNNFNVLLNYFERQLEQPSEQIKKRLESQGTVSIINQKLESIWKFQQNYEKNADQIILAISSSLSNSSYNDEIIHFLLGTIDFLINANKIILMKKIINKQARQSYLVGQAPKHYNPILRKRCRNVLMNLAATSQEELIKPYLSKISNTIKKCPQFSQIYHNIFLTQDIRTPDKIELFNDFLHCLENNTSELYENDWMFMRILYVIYGTSPSIVKVNVGNIKSLEVNYRVLCLLQSYISAMTFKIEYIYSQDLYSQQFETVAYICRILNYLMKQQESLLTKVSKQLNIMKFLEQRLKKKTQIPNLKCLQLALQALNSLHRTYFIYQSIQQSHPRLQMQIIKSYEELYNELFSRQNSQNQKQTQSNEILKLKLRCLKQFNKIFRNMSEFTDKCRNLLKQGVITKSMQICVIYHQNETNSETFKEIKSLSLEIICNMIYFLIEAWDKKLLEFQFNIEDILIGEFFYPESQEKINLFSIVFNELRAISNPNKDSIQVFKKTINLMNELLLRIQWQCEIQYNETDSLEQICLRNKWFIIYRQFLCCHELRNEFQRLFDSDLKIIQYDPKIKSQLNSILDVCDKIEQVASTMMSTNKNPTSSIQLEI